MYRFRDIKVFDKMVKSNSILVGLSLLLLVWFVAYASDWFGWSIWLQQTDWYAQLLVSGWIDYLPLLIIVIPLIGSFVELYCAKASPRFRDQAVIYTGFITLVVVLFSYPLILDNDVSFELANVFDLGLSFRIDTLGYIVLLLSAYLWFYVMVYAHVYMQREKHSTRFFFFLGLTYATVIGAIVAGDLLTMFVFFEVMTVSSYMLVIHGQNEESYQAGYKYLVMGLIGGFLIFAAIVLMYFNVGDLGFDSAIVQLAELGATRYWIIGLIVLGFGVKAGMAPLHVWLPKAHPVAPSPASALLSGVMIKIGAFGIIRAVTSYYFPTKDMMVGGDDPIWFTASTIGAILIWVGIVTMTIGVFLALLQANMKKMLAYHSISQMGYIIVGIGVAMYLGYKGALGYGGAVYHIVNHALFKSLLFMVAGVVYYHTHEQNMYKLGGLWKKLPVTTVVFLIAALGISGVPLFNGYVSKTMLHHAIVEAHEYGSSIFLYAEWIFLLVSAGTVCSFVKMFYYVFIRKTDNAYPDATFDFSSFDVALWAIAILIVWIGWNPNFLLDALVIPQLNRMAYSSDFIDHYVVGINVFAGEDLLVTLGILGFGGVMFVIGDKLHLFHKTLPKWLSIEYWFFLPAFLVMRGVCRRMYGKRFRIDDKEYEQLNEISNDRLGFIERFIITSNVVNRRYEQSLIRKDALIYSVLLMVLLLWMMMDQLIL